MRFGACCGAAERFEMVKNAVYDYIEGCLSDIAKLDDVAWADYKAKLATTGLKAEAFNGFFFGDFKLVGENVEFSMLAEYADRALARAAEIGGEIAVVGSGKARNIPEGFDPNKAEEQFCEVLRICGDAAKKHGMRVVIEPLNYDETNLINTVAEGKAMVKKCGHSHVGCLADFFHVYRNGETLDAIAETVDPLWHVHLARANGDRGVPMPGEDDEIVAKWAKTLKASGYDGRISLEAIFRPDFETAITRVKPLLNHFK